ncbi:MAG: ligand-binding sensor domain-containing protein, partial [Blastocatellia bacterium]
MASMISPGFESDDFCWPSHPGGRVEARVSAVLRIGRLLALMALLLLFVPPAQAQSKYLHTTWTTENGLPQNSINAIVQTRDGYLWLGTHGGLARFDGVKFTVFETGNTPELKSSRILSLFEDHAGALWIGTQYGGLTRYANGTFKTFTTQDGFPDAFVTSIAEDGEGNLFCTTNKGIVRFSAGRFAVALAVPATDAIRSRDGSVWFSGGQKLIRYRGGKFSDFAIPTEAMPERISGLIEAEDGSIWLTMGRKLLRFYEGSFATLT